MSARSLQIRQLPCIACEIWGVAHQPFQTTEHHLNLGGRAGQKRRGDAYSIPLCRWHHTGYTAGKYNALAMAGLYGPSLAKQSKAFRAAFGTDDELLARTDRMLARVDDAIQLAAREA